MCRLEKLYKDNKGLIIEKENVDELTSALFFLVENPKEIEKFAENVYKYARNYLNWDVIIKDLLQEMIQRGLEN